VKVEKYLGFKMFLIGMAVWFSLCLLSEIDSDSGVDMNGVLVATWTPTCKSLKVIEQKIEELKSIIGNKEEKF